MTIDEKIEAALDLSNAPEDAKKDMIQGVKDIIENRLVLLVDEMLTDEQRAEFERIQQEKDAVEARLWLEKNVVNTQELYVSLLDDYLAEKRRGL